VQLSIRHTLATLSYRLGKVLRDTPDTFGDFQIHESVRTPVQILAHINDLMDWALTQVEGKVQWHDSVPQLWGQEVARFFRAIQVLDDRLESGAAPGVSGDRLFQGAIADAITHTGQLAMLRRIAGIPVRGESYAAAEIVTGRVGSEQAPARREFD
jgi:hypothetical protein